MISYDSFRGYLHAPLLAGMLCACGGQAPATDATDDGATQAAAESSLTDETRLPGIDVTAQDSAIFATTLAWAIEQRLDTLALGEIVARVGRRFVGAPYIPKTLDPPGPERLIVNLRTFDCVTFVESTLALGRVIRAGDTDFGAFVRELRRIRYRNGVGDAYPDRLHYFSEWIDANQRKGLVRNITAEIGGEPDTTHIDFMSSHADLYWQLQDTVYLREIRQTEASLAAQPRSWIPETRIAGLAEHIRNGDVIAATSTVPGLDIAHTGLALWLDGRLHLMHAPLVGSVVEISELPLAERIRRIQGQDGIMVARPL
jgi:hypothetical protein